MIKTKHIYFLATFLLILFFKFFENSYLILNGIKICLGVNSSLKFKKIFNKKNEIFIEHLKGSIFINQRTNYKIKIKIFKNLI